MNEELSRIGLNYDSHLAKKSDVARARIKRAAHGLLILVLSLIVLQLGLMILKNSSSYFKTKLLKWDAIPLAGKENQVIDKIPALNFKNFFSKKWQTQFETWFNNALPFRSGIVRTHNQVFYNLFSKSYAESGLIIVGKDDQLYSLNYVERYYNLPRSHFNQAAFDHWADDLQALSNFFKRRGQHFVYLITPSKASYTSEHLPDCNRCEKTKTRPDYHLVTSTLKKRGFAFVDGSEIILGLKKVPGEAEYIFPKGGIHWTVLAAAHVTRELMEHMLKPWVLKSSPELKFSYQLKRAEHAWDMDILMLANLLRPKSAYEVPKVSVVPFPIPKSFKKPMKVAIIGGSFTEQPAKVLVETQLFDQIDIFGYLIAGRLQYKKGNPASFFPFNEIPLKSNHPDKYFPEDYQDLFNADIVILEENEENLRSNHFKLLLKRTVGKVALY